AWGTLLERGELQQRRVNADLGIQVGADPPECFVHGQRVEVAAALVQQIPGDRGEAWLVSRILRRSDWHQHKTGDERNFVVLDRADAQAVAQGGAAHFREVEAEWRPGGRQPRAIDRHQATTAGAASASATAVRPSGTTLRMTRDSGRRYSAAACCSEAALALRYRARSRSK